MLVNELASLIVNLSPSKGNETRWNFWSAKKLPLPQRQLLERDRKPHRLEFLIQYPARELVYRYHPEKIPKRHDLSCSHQKVP